MVLRCSRFAFQVAPMNQRRVDFYLDAFADFLIAVGGRNENGALSSVEIYDPVKDSWTYVAGLPRYCTIFVLISIDHLH